MKITHHSTTIERSYNDPPYWVARYHRPATDKRAEYTASTSGTTELDAAIGLINLMGGTK